MRPSVARRGRLRIEELFSLPTIPIVRSSWRGDRAAFYWDRTGRFELYVIDLRTRVLRQVSDGQVPRLTWKEERRARVLRSAEEIQQTVQQGTAHLATPGIVVNMPMLTWPGGQR